MDGWEDIVFEAVVQAIERMGSWHIADLQQLRQDAAAWSILRRWEGPRVSARRRARGDHHGRSGGAEQATSGGQDPQAGKGVPEIRPSSLRGRDSVSSYRLIEAEKTSFPVRFVCRMLLGVSRSGYYGWRGRPSSASNRADAALTEKIREVHERSRRTYGSPRFHAELRALGTRCSRKRVERLMRKSGLQGCMRGRRRGITLRSKKRAAPFAEDLAKRDFAATRAD